MHSLRMLGSFVAILAVLTFQAAQAAVVKADATFNNPIIEGDSADPMIIRIGDFYYLTFTHYDGIKIYQSSVMTDFHNKPVMEIFHAAPGYINVFAPEFHILDGDLYVYFCMAEEGKGHRMYVIKADNPQNPMGTWSPPVMLLADSEHGGIDATIMHHNGKRYYVWASSARGPLFLAIAELYDPYTVSNNTVTLRIPQAEWECYEGCTNEGPHFLYNDNKSYLIFSASSTYGPNYSLGMMSIESDKDPLVPSNWWFGPDGPVFYRNDAEGVYTTGHAAFVLSPDGTETWMSYHATVDTGRTDRIARLEKIEWNEDGSPRFPRPHGFGRPLEVPHGQLPVDNTKFTNPIIDGDSADPMMIRIGDYYYLAFTSPGWKDLTIYKSPVMTNFRQAPSKVLFTAPPGFFDVWAPEFHIIDGELYIYFTMAQEGSNHHLYVMKADNPNDPFGNWEDPVRLSPDDGADATIFNHGNGKTYFVWSSFFSLYIAEMYSPYNVSLNKVKLRTPTTDWECAGACIDEGPFFLYNQGVSYMIFSAASTWEPDYSLGMMSISGDKDPMNVDNWWYGTDGPVFYKNEAESVYTTGHAAFVTSPDGTETWMTYHGTVNGYGDRIARLEKIEWNQDGSPRFPRPHGYTSPMDVPRGQYYNAPAH